MSEKPLSQPKSVSRTEDDHFASTLAQADAAELAPLLSSHGVREKHIRVLLQRTDLPSVLLATIARNLEWVRYAPIRLALVTHPHMPRKEALAMLRGLFVSDLVRVSLRPSAPTEVRCIAEELVVERIAQLPTAERLLLARSGSARVAGALLAQGNRDALHIVLENPFLTEAQVLKVLGRESVPAHVVITVAEHPKWCVRYSVRLALVSNPRTPPALALRFLPSILMPDLVQLSRGARLSPRLRAQVKREISRRNGGMGNTRPR